MVKYFLDGTDTYLALLNVQNTPRDKNLKSDVEEAEITTSNLQNAP